MIINPTILQFLECLLGVMLLESFFGSTMTSDKGTDLACAVDSLVRVIPPSSLGNVLTLVKKAFTENSIDLLASSEVQDPGASGSDNVPKFDEPCRNGDWTITVRETTYKVKPSLLEVPGKCTLFAKFVHDHKGHGLSVVLPDAVGSEYFSKFLEILQQKTSLLNLIEEWSLSTRTMFRAVLKYLGFDHLDTPILLKEPTPLRKFATVTYSTHPGFKTLIHSSNPATISTEGSRFNEGFFIRFGRSRIFPDKITLGVQKPVNGEGLNKFKVYILVLISIRIPLRKIYWISNKITKHIFVQ